MRHSVLYDITRPHAGKNITSKELAKLVKAAHAEIAPSSYLFADHGTTNITGCACANTDARLWDTLSRGLFYVRPDSAREVGKHAALIPSTPDPKHAIVTQAAQLQVQRKTGGVRRDKGPASLTK